MSQKDKKFLILPGCDDTNRGDQALIWETVALAKEAGFAGSYYMIASDEKSEQSKSEGINNIDYILPHPSSHFRKNNNINYGLLLKIKWAAVSIVDSIKALSLLVPIFRNIAKKVGSDKLRRSMSVYEHASAAFVKGGGFIHAYRGVVSTYAVFYDLYHIILALSMGIDVYVMPNSYGPFLGIGSNWLVKKVLSKCKVITSRESISHKTLLNQMGLHSEVFPDLAFYLEPDANLTDEQHEKLNKIPLKDKKCIALTMRPYRFPASENPKEEYIQYKNVFAKFIAYLSERGYYPVIIEHTYSESEHERDMSCIKDVAELLGDTCTFSVYSDLSLNCRQMKYVYSQFACIIGTRFHSVIFSIAAGVPAIAITYGGNKGQGIMKDIGLDAYAIEIEALCFERLVEAFCDLMDKKEDVKEKIKYYIEAGLRKKDRLIQLMERKL